MTNPVRVSGFGLYFEDFQQVGLLLFRAECCTYHVNALLTVRELTVDQDNRRNLKLVRLVTINHRERSLTVADRQA